MRSLGCHVSIAGGFDKALCRAEALGCTALQVFTHAPSAWAMKPLAQSDAEAFRAALAGSSIQDVVVHTMYLLNLASPDPALLARSAAALGEECSRAVSLGIPSVVTHPGAHRGSGASSGIERIRSALGRLRETQMWQETDCRLLLENTAGAGTTLGATWEHLALLLAKLPSDRFGACLDTCHAHAAGYDLSSPRGVQSMLDDIDRLLGLHRVMLIHLNDSVFPSGSRRDRHEHIGLGEIGPSGITAILNHPALSEVPVILETPKEHVDGMEGDLRNLQRVKQLYASGNRSFSSRVDRQRP